jgi:hypothetical protein
VRSASAHTACALANRAQGEDGKQTFSTVRAAVVAAMALSKKLANAKKVRRPAACVRMSRMRAGHAGRASLCARPDMVLLGGARAPATCTNAVAHAALSCTMQAPSDAAVESAVALAEAGVAAFQAAVRKNAGAPIGIDKVLADLQADEQP